MSFGIAMEEQCFFKDVLRACGNTDKSLSDCGRIQKIIDASDIRGDTHVRQALEPGSTNSNPTTIRCHKNCVSSYISPTNLKHYSNKRKSDQESGSSSNAKQLRSSTVPFDPKKHCLYCLNVTECILPHEYDSKTPQKYRRPASQVMTKTKADGKIYLDSLHEKCLERNDKLGNVVYDRLLGIKSDLIADEARYHRECQRDFMRKTDKSSQAVDGPPAEKAFEKVCDVIASDRSKIWNSHEIEELYLAHVISPSQRLSRRTLFERVTRNFGDEVTTLHGAGIATLLVFKHHVAKTLKISDDLDHDMDECLKKVGNTIKEECIQAKQGFDEYSPHIDKFSAAECTSDMLTSLLSSVHSKLQPYSLPSLLIGNIVSSVVTSQPTPLQIALGVLLSGHKSLIEELYKYRVTCSYNEVRRFLRSAAVVAARDKCWAGMTDCAIGGLVQVVIDNFDAMISSQNCRLDCHVLAMIATQATVTEKYIDQPIPRLTRTEMTLPIECELPIVPYEGPKKPPMPLQATTWLETSQEMTIAAAHALTRARELDFEFLSQVIDDPSTPEYNGFNTRHCREAGMSLSPKSAVRYMPLINMTPADPQTVNTAVAQGINITKDANQGTLVITADQQLYKVIVDIIFHTPDMLTEVVAVLGHMHFLMDFVGAIGSLAAGSGLREVLSGTFGSVDKLLEGKKYPQNIRALRLLTEEVLRPLFIQDPKLESMDDLDSALEKISLESRTSKMWIELVIKPTFLIMAFTRADHEGDHALHVITASKMLPYMFAANHHNYARYGLFYVRSMRWLPPEIEEKFLKGEQTLHHQEGLWNGVPSDQFIESTWMRHGKGPSGVIGNTQNPQTMATWVYSMNAAQTLITDLKKMYMEDEKGQRSHKEETKERIRKDALDRTSLRQTLHGFIDPLDPQSHSEGKLMNICTGQIASPQVNVDSAVDIGSNQLQEFERTWPEGFYSRISKHVITFESVKKHAKIGGTQVIDPEGIYARVIGLLLSERDLNLTEVLACELTGYPPSMFRSDGTMRPATDKSTLKQCLGKTISRRVWGDPTILVIDVSAVLWTLDWPSNGFMSDVIDAFKKLVKHQLMKSHVHLIMDRYIDYSMKSSTRALRSENVVSRPHNLRLTAPIVKREHILRCTHNKIQLNKLITESILEDDEYLRECSTTHKLVCSHENTVPTEVSRGRKRPQMYLASSHEEADIRITKHAISCGHDPDARICVISDDTDVFALLCYFYKQEGLTCAMTMRSPVVGRDTFDIKGTTEGEPGVVDKCLALHALSGCDTVAATYGVGKKTALTVAKGMALPKIGKLQTSFEEIEKEATEFMVACYKAKPCSTMTQCRQQQWAIKTGKSRTSAPKLCTLPPTSEAFHQNVLRAHIQVSHWYSALEEDPPLLNPEEFGWVADTENKTLIPRPVADGVEVSPEIVQKLIKCGCDSEQSCKGAKCGCTSRQMPCTLFCACGGRLECHNPFMKVARGDDDDSDGENI